jgi:hypothetical protein
MTSPSCPLCYRSAAAQRQTLRFESPRVIDIAIVFLEKIIIIIVMHRPRIRRLPEANRTDITSFRVETRRDSRAPLSRHDNIIYSMARLLYDIYDRTPRVNHGDKLTDKGFKRQKPHVHVHSLRYLSVGRTFFF